MPVKRARGTAEFAMNRHAGLPHSTSEEQVLGLVTSGEAGRLAWLCRRDVWQAANRGMTKYVAYLGAPAGERPRA